MNERIIRLKEDYAKNESKIASLQAKNKKLAEKIQVVVTKKEETSFTPGAVFTI